jgi:hypothetical protein
MNRRTFVTGLAAVLAAPFGAEAQQTGKMYRIGILCHVPCQGRAVDAFGRALREMGYVEGHTIEFEYRDAEWKNERLAALAAWIRLTPNCARFAAGSTRGPGSGMSSPG